jgi:hypothetical protein
MLTLCPYCTQHCADSCILQVDFQKQAFEMCWFESAQADFQMLPSGIG